MKSGTAAKLKFKKLQRRLKLPLWQCMGLLESIWQAALANAPEGDIGRHTDEDIAAMIDWEGDESELIAALVETGWLDHDDDFRLIIHDWSDHAPNFLRGNFAKHGKQFADVVAKQRARERAKQGAICTLPPNQTKPNLTKSNQTIDSSVVDEPRREPLNGDAVLEFPCNGKKKTWPLTQTQIDEWRGLYPQVDVLGECRKALAWVNANQRKTHGGMSRFLVGWLNRNNDRSRGRSLPVAGGGKVYDRSRDIEMVRGPIVKAGRKAGRTEEQINDAVQEALKQRGLA